MGQIINYQGNCLTNAGFIVNVNLFELFRIRVELTCGLFLTTLDASLSRAESPINIEGFFGDISVIQSLLAYVQPDFISRTWLPLGRYRTMLLSSGFCSLNLIQR